MKLNKQIFELDENGYFVREVITPGDLPREEYPRNYTEMPFPRDSEGSQLPFYRARFNGAEWIEDMPAEEIAEINSAPRHITETDMLIDYVLELDAKIIMIELGI